MLILIEEHRASKFDDNFLWRFPHRSNEPLTFPAPLWSNQQQVGFWKWCFDKDDDGGDEQAGEGGWAAQIDMSEYSDSRKFVQRTLQTHSCWHDGNRDDDDDVDDGH